VKLYNDDGDEDSVSWPFAQSHPILTICLQDTPQPSGSSTPLDRTSTGIISNKPQKVGLSALTTLAASKVTGLSVMALAKRESARRGLYSRFFRGPVLGPDTEGPPVLEVTPRSSPSRSESNGPKRNVTVTENEKKRKSREEVKEETGVARKKRKSKKEDETKEERRKRRRLKALKGEAKEIPELRLDGEVEAGLTRVPTAPESTDYSRGRDREKKRKRKERESTVHNDG
jgi:hypothetical protein